MSGAALTAQALAEFLQALCSAFPNQALLQARCSRAAVSGVATWVAQASPVVTGLPSGVRALVGFL